MDAELLLPVQKAALAGPVQVVPVVQAARSGVVLAMDAVVAQAATHDLAPREPR